MSSSNSDDDDSETPEGKFANFVMDSLVDMAGQENKAIEKDLFSLYKEVRRVKEQKGYPGTIEKVIESFENFEKMLKKTKCLMPTSKVLILLEQIKRLLNNKISYSKFLDRPILFKTISNHGIMSPKTEIAGREIQSYTYPEKFTMNDSKEKVQRIAIRDSDYFCMIKWGCKTTDICGKDDIDRLCDYLDDFEYDRDIFGFLYYTFEKNSKLIGFTIFKVDEWTEEEEENNYEENNNNNNNKNNNKNDKEEEKIIGKPNQIFDVPYGSPIVEGILRCSKQKGIGTMIQSDIEDFARHNKIPLIRIIAVSEKLRNDYYIPKFNYTKHPYDDEFIYKEMKGGAKVPPKGGRRKTRKQKKAKRQTRKARR